MAAQVIVVGTLKGGVGKTRLAMLMALYLAVVHGRTVKVFDGDTVSQTAHDWHRDAKRMGREWPAGVEVVRHPFPDINEEIEAARSEVDHVIGDIGGGNPTVFSSALEWANLLLTPIGADESEIRRLGQTWREARTAAANSAVGGFDSYVVLSRTDHRTRQPADAREILTSGEGGHPVYPLCDTELRYRVGYSRAFARVPADFLDVPALLAEVGVAELPSVPAGKAG
ncbi:ParA family protein [Streptomyces sp. URMC 129]|uniref:ParA family protein n=1 Tax=Streptomyces sp. URMC 129 TaxID=3423407 RepID=UPI003F1B0CA1